MNVANIVSRDDDWPLDRFNNNSEFLLRETHDDEGAVKIFFDRTWKEIDVNDLLEHPTAQWFLNDVVFCGMLPALLAVVYWATEKEDDREKGVILADHIVANLHRRWHRISNKVTPKHTDRLRLFTETFGRENDNRMFSRDSNNKKPETGSTPVINGE